MCDQCEKPLSYVNVIATRWGNVSYGTAGAWWQHNFVFNHEILLHLAIYITSSDVATDLETLSVGIFSLAKKTAVHLEHFDRIKVPLARSAQSVNVHSLWDVDRLSHFVDNSERPLDTIKNILHNTRAQFHR